MEFLQKVYGITPAYAGKRLLDAGDTRFAQDHPRLCGEKIEERNPSEYVLGSPPPMRGKVHRFGNVKDQVGITPAYAGKRQQAHMSRTLQRDHPRLCGEKSGSNSSLSKSMGSPPPMRGKDKKSPQWYTIPGITPAYAGKSWQPGKVPPLP